LFIEDKSKATKPCEPSPEELTEESSLDSIQSQNDTSNTSLEDIEEESSISIVEQKPTKQRGRPRKSTSATPKPAKPPAKSSSAQPTKAKSAPSSTAKAPSAGGVRGRKPKLAVVPETQLDISVAEEVDDVEFAPRPRQESILPASVVRKTSLEVCILSSTLTVATD
jgi:hypothetical protein